MTFRRRRGAHPRGEVGRPKEQVSLAEAIGVALRKTGAELTGCCPFHEDGTPSLVISPEKNLWYCLGACQADGSVIDWVMRPRSVVPESREAAARRHARRFLGRARGEAVDATLSALNAGPERRR